MITRENKYIVNIGNVQLIEKPKGPGFHKVSEQVRQTRHKGW